MFNRKKRFCAITVISFNSNFSVFAFPLPNHELRCFLASNNEILFGSQLEASKTTYVTKIPERFQGKHWKMFYVSAATVISYFKWYIIQSSYNLTQELLHVFALKSLLKYCPIYISKEKKSIPTHWFSKQIELLLLHSLHPTIFYSK